MRDRGAQILDWLLGWFGWLGDEAMDLLWEAVDWVEDLGVFAYALGAGCVLLVVMVLLWYASRR